MTLAAKSSTPTVILAGGGTGGHIYPNVAIAERVSTLMPEARIFFVVSSRAGDATIMAKFPYRYASTDITPLPSIRKPWKLLGFAATWFRSASQATAILREQQAACLVTSGGFVSGPMMVAAAKLALPRAMLNLDAVPGKANRQLVRYAEKIYTVHASSLLPGASIVGLPLRQASLGLQRSPEDAREALGLERSRPVLFITGATHGAASMIEAMIALTKQREFAELMASWQVFHQCGTYDVSTLQAAYDAAGVRARVVAYCDQMGSAWRAASLTISRAGAGSVAEAWANQAPAIFMPNPFHDDGHQKKNAQAMVACGGATIIEDNVDAVVNSAALLSYLRSYISAPTQENEMRAALARQMPADGANDLAQWCIAQCRR